MIGSQQPPADHEARGRASGNFWRGHSPVMRRAGAVVLAVMCMVMVSATPPPAARTPPTRPRATGSSPPQGALVGGSPRVVVGGSQPRSTGNGPRRVASRPSQQARGARTGLGMPMLETRRFLSNFNHLLFEGTHPRPHPLPSTLRSEDTRGAQRQMVE
jgi:hypothetical protein